MPSSRRHPLPHSRTARPRSPISFLSVFLERMISTGTSLSVAAPSSSSSSAPSPSSCLNSVFPSSNGTAGIIHMPATSSPVEGTTGYLINQPAECHAANSSPTPSLDASSLSLDQGFLMTGCPGVQQLYNIDVHTLRLLMSGKEVGSVIGKKGSNVKRYREESGARINICDASSPERIITVIGSIAQIQTAFSLMCQKFEEDLQNTSLTSEERSTSSTASTPVITLRLLIPGPQCGSIIGKGGSKIKEIRQVTGASVQVASDILPQSTERIVTVSGTTKSIAQCIKIICELLQECPNKVPVIPYKPRPAVGVGVLLPGSVPPPYIPANGQALGQYGVEYPPKNLLFPTPTCPPATGHPFPPTMGSTANSTAQQLQQFYESAAALAAQQAAPLSGLSAPAFLSLPLGGAAGAQPQGPMLGHPAHAANTLAAMQFYPGLPGGLTFAHPALASLSPASLGCLPFGLLPAMAAAAGGNSGAMGSVPYTQELIIPNELIGCVIGRGGNKINEIRQASGAQIKISNVESGGSDRKIVMSGNVEQVQMAKVLIQRRLSTELLLGSRHLEA